MSSVLQQRTADLGEGKVQEKWVKFAKFYSWTLLLNSIANDLQSIERQKPVVLRKQTHSSGDLCWVVQFSLVFVGKTSIPVEDIISVQKQRTSSTPTHGQVFPILDASSPSLNSDSDEECKSFTINYAKRLIDPRKCEQGSTSSSSKKVNKWRIHSITLYNNDKMIVKEWFTTLTKILNGKHKFDCGRRRWFSMSPVWGDGHSGSLWIFLFVNERRNI